MIRTLITAAALSAAVVFSHGTAVADEVADVDALLMNLSEARKTHTAEELSYAFAMAPRFEAGCGYRLNLLEYNIARYIIFDTPEQMARLTHIGSVVDKALAIHTLAVGSVKPEDGVCGTLKLMFAPIIGGLK